MSIPPDLKLACAVLAGGRARRYGGAAKGLLDSGQARCILDRLIGEVTAAGIDEIVIVANDASYAGCGREVIADLRRGIGPLGGIETALAHFAGEADAVLILPCDLPSLGAGEIRALARAHAAAPGKIAVAVTGKNFWHPLCAVVHIDLLGKITRAIDRGERKVQDLWCRLGAAAVDFGRADAFFNVNTPDDLARWRQMRSN